MFPATPDFLEEHSSHCLQFTHYWKFSNVRIRLEFPSLLPFFFLNRSFQSVLSTLSIWSFKMFLWYHPSSKFCFAIKQCLLCSISVEKMVLILNAWLYGIVFCLNVNGDSIADQWVFGIELSEKYCFCLYMSMHLKMMHCCVKYYVQIRLFYVCSCLLSVHIMNISSIYRKCSIEYIYSVFQIVPWKYLRMLEHRFYPLHIPIFVNNSLS